MDVPQQIRTKRLVLRQHKRKDLPAFVEFLADSVATRDMAFTDEQKTPEGAKAMLDYVIASYQTEAAVFSLTIADPESDEYLGACGVSPLEAPNEVEVYYTVTQAWQKNGYAMEAMVAVIDYLWKSTDANMAVAFVVPRNQASIRVAEKLGFLDAGPIERKAVTGDHEHQRMSGRKYVLERPAERTSGPTLAP